MTTNRALCFTDTETTGLNRFTRVPWEIAIIRRDPATGVDKEYVWMDANPDLSDADPTALKFNKFWERHPLGGMVDSYKIMTQDSTFVNWTDAEIIAEDVMTMTRDAHIIGCVASFDDETLARYLRAHGALWSPFYRPRCVETLAIGWLRARGVMDWPLDSKSDDLFREIGIDTSAYARHTALGDARLARDVWDTIMGDTPS